VREGHVIQVVEQFGVVHPVVHVFQEVLFVFQLLVLHQFAVVVFGFDDNRLKNLFVLLEVQPIIDTVSGDFGELAVLVDQRTVLLFDVITVDEVVALFECLLEHLSQGYDLILFEQFNVGGGDAVPDVVEPRFDVGLLRVRVSQDLEFSAHFAEDFFHCVFELVQLGVLVLRLVEHDPFELDVPHAVADGVGQREDRVEFAFVGLPFVCDVKADEHLQPLSIIVLDEVAEVDVVWSVDRVFEPGGPDNVVLNVLESVFLLFERVLFGYEHQEEVVAVFDQPLLEVGNQSLVFVNRVWSEYVFMHGYNEIGVVAMVVVVDFVFNHLFDVFHFFHWLVEMFNFVELLFGNVQEPGLVEFGVDFDLLPFSAEREPPFIQSVFQDTELICHDVVLHAEVDVFAGAGGELHLLVLRVRYFGDWVVGAVEGIEHAHNPVDDGFVDQFHAGAVEFVVVLDLLDEAHVEEVGVVSGQAVGWVGPDSLDVFELAGLQCDFVEVQRCDFVDFAVVPHLIAYELLQIIFRHSTLR